MVIFLTIIKMCRNQLDTLGGSPQIMRFSCENIKCLINLVTQIMETKLLVILIFGFATIHFKTSWIVLAYCPKSISIYMDIKGKFPQFRGTYEREKIFLETGFSTGQKMKMNYIKQGSHRKIGIFERSEVRKDDTHFITFEKPRWVVIQRDEDGRELAAAYR